MNSIWFPAQRVIRTVLQVVTALLVGGAAFFAMFALVAPQVLEAIREVLPPDWYAALLAFVAFVATIAGVLAKIMAIPQVNEWLKKFGAGTAPNGAIAYTDLDGNTTPMTRRQWRAFIRNGGTTDRSPSADELTLDETL